VEMLSRRVLKNLMILWTIWLVAAPFLIWMLPKQWSRLAFLVALVGFVLPTWLMAADVGKRADLSPRRRRELLERSAGIGTWVVLLSVLAGCKDVRSTRLVNHAGDLYAKGAYQEAAAEYKQAIELTPYDITAHCGLGNALQAIGQNDEAIKAYSDSVRTGQRWAGSRSCRFQLGRLLFRANRLTEARDQFQTLRNENAEDCHAQVYLALIDRAAGKPDELEALRRDRAGCLVDIPEAESTR
jgi:hypothetical protein